MKQARKLIPLNLRFFGEEPPAEPATGNPEPPKQANEPPAEPPKPYKSFNSKKEFDALEMAAKARGKTDILTALGLKDESELEAVKAAMKTAQEAADAQKSEQQRREEADRKTQGKLAEAESARYAAEARATMLEQQLAVRLAGVSDEDYVEAVQRKVAKLVTDDTDFATALTAFLSDEANAKYTSHATSKNNRAIKVPVSTGGQPPPNPNIPTNLTASLFRRG